MSKSADTSLNHVAVVGATGQVGRLVLEIMAERAFPVGTVSALATKTSAGKTVPFGDQTLTVQPLKDFEFTGVDLAIFCVPLETYVEHIPRATAAGAVVLDNSNHYRSDPDVPLIIPEVNPQHIALYSRKNIIAGANCATIQLLLAVKPLHDVAPIKRLVVSTYHSASGIGYKAMRELTEATQAHEAGEPYTPKAFPRNLAYNVMPQAEGFMENGQTRGEWKMQHDASKIMGAYIPISVTCVRVPVAIGHSESVNIEFEAPLSAAQAKEVLKTAPGIALNEDDAAYATPAEIAGTDPVYVSRVREDHTLPYGLNMWITCDNLRKGAALNTVQTAEYWLEYVRQTGVQKAYAR